MLRNGACSSRLRGGQSFRQLLDLVALDSESGLRVSSVHLVKGVADLLFLVVLRVVLSRPFRITASFFPESGKDL